MESLLKFEELKHLTLNQQQINLKIRHEKMHRQLNDEYHQCSININLNRVKQAKDINPNYIHHKLKKEDVETLLKNLLNQCASITIDNYKTVNIVKITNLEWKYLSHTKHPEWLKSVKHRKAGHLFKSLLHLSIWNFPTLLHDTFRLLNIDNIDYSKTSNQICKQILTNIKSTKEILYLNEEIANLRLLSATDRATIDRLKKEIQELTLRKPISSKATWKYLALEMKQKGYSIREITKNVNKGRTTVSTYLNTPTVKAQLTT